MNFPQSVDPTLKSNKNELPTFAYNRKQNCEIFRKQPTQLPEISISRANIKSPIIILKIEHLTQSHI